MKKHKTRVFLFQRFCLAAAIGCVLFIGSGIWAEKQAYIAPDYQMVSLESVLQEGHRLSDADYQLLYEQTGLGKQGINSVLKDPSRQVLDAEAIKKIAETQKIFFTKPQFRCFRENWIVQREQIVNRSGEVIPWRRLVSLQDGDILITKASHIGGWRNGHAGIVIDGEKGRTIEAITIGEKTATRTLSKWEKYPNVVVLRLRNADAKKRAEIALWAEINMKDVPYRITAGLWGSGGTQCAHLIWRSYMQFGYDLDSNGGWLVTPKQLAASPLLEVVQVYGMNPDELWR